MTETRRRTSRGTATAGTYPDPEILRAVYEAAPVPILVWKILDGEAVLMACNPAARALLADDSPEGASSSSLFSPSLTQRILACWREGSEGAPTEIIRRDHPSGNEILLEAHFATVRDAVILRLIDRSARLEAEKALAATEARFRNATKMEAVGLLAGGIAHDFNNLLAVITSSASFLEEDLDDDDERRSDVEEIHSAADRGRALVRQLLAFARQEPVKPRPVDLNEVVRNAEPLLRRAVGETIQVSITEDPELWTTLVDPGQVDQLLLNVVVNSRDAMPDGGRIDITTSNAVIDESSGIAPEMRKGEFIKLCIVDNGTGITEAVRDRAFEPFFTTKEIGSGSGLGLSSVYGTVKQADGFVYIDRIPTGGTSVMIYLPRCEEKPKEGAQVEASQRTTVIGSKTVLLVEDEDAVRRVLARLLTRNGYRVIEARSGGEALKKATQGEQIDLLVTDVVMPEMSGLTLTKRLKAAGLELKTLFISGYPQEIVSAKGVVDSEMELLEKPFTEEQLLRSLGALFAGES